ncbi:glycoside hydrolase family 97 protein [Aridibaculum aurantiacum]|uniref:glycoside hydrolase family 97 protein n=1 Tax=Aridibaculum aurantiacum TaxID=2810307 RepID=UPI001A979C3E|nr:glycoside hydrolase family 97 protein [Aridibaculum aurantiacum]
MVFQILRSYTKYVILVCVTVLVTAASIAQRAKVYQLTSPDNKIKVQVNAGADVTWAIDHENTKVLSPSAISLVTTTGVLGKNTVLKSAKSTTVNSKINPPVYKKATVIDHYNQLILNFKGDYSIVFRAYNDGAAYRFISGKKDSLTIQAEQCDLKFDSDYQTFVSYVREPRHAGDQFQTSFENLYNENLISAFLKDSLGMLPMLVGLRDGKKAVMLEADLEDYPGMYVALNDKQVNSFKAVHAPYPASEQAGGFNNMNFIVTSRANYIARTSGTRSFPWRAIVISSSDKELANNDMVYKLASPSRLDDISWIRPGKVAWDWWNDWNISHVDFRAGINTPTYKYYIDFAAANNIEYIVMDEGWSESTDIGKISPRINLQEIIDYGKQKNVDVILWATWYALNGRLDEVFSKYANMGVKGFKIDFLDRDDQKMVASTYEIARKAAAYKLLVDLHGIYKPTGLQRTYPNVIGFEGVRGLENAKWAPSDDVPRYDVTLPFIRMMAGAVDYTPGAMRNATKANFRAIHSMPMSQGTRSHQLAMYIVFEAPLGMLSDNPTAYMKEQESTKFISAIPTVFDETVALDGKLGDYISIARRKGSTWYVGAMTNWNERDLTIDLSFLDDGVYEAEIFKDGINADRDATDYKREVLRVSKKDKLQPKLMAGGGWAAIFQKIN